MTEDPRSIDGVLVQWGDRLFYPGNRIVKETSQPRLLANLVRRRAAVIRARIEATVIRRAPQVMVKVTGGGRGMKAIAAHFRYISKHGRLDIENERGQSQRGKEALRELVDDWRLGGTRIDEVSDRREAFNLMLSMPRGTDPLIVQHAAREFARVELSDHKYVMVLHDHQANPHVHISVRAESRLGKRLNPRKADLQRWRETFAEMLRERGVEAEATWQATRGQTRNYEPLWRIKAREDRRLCSEERSNRKATPKMMETRTRVIDAWLEIARALGGSGDPSDRELGRSLARFVVDMSNRRLQQRLAGEGRVQGRNRSDPAPSR